MNRSLLIGYSFPVVITLATSGCATKQKTHQSEAHAAHWTYSGATGPAHWGELSPDYALCSTGKSQSPIDIASTTPRDLPNIVFRYHSTPLNVINNGHTVQVNCAPGGFIELEGERFELVQFHFHLPSEHTVGGTHADAEMHLVHKSASGRLAVVGVMVRAGAGSPAWDILAANLPESGKSVELPNLAIDPTALLPTDQRTYRYDGSLTTPPGTEGVRWSLMVQPVTMSPSQLGSFRRRFHANNRPVQSLNGRQVLQDTTP